MRIALLGVGLIGGSIGLAARERVAGAEVTGFDLDRAEVDLALERGALDSAAGSVEEALEGAAACFVCAPVSALPRLCAEALVAAGDDCVISDVGSTKRHLATLATDPRFIGGHPIAGSEAAGAAHSRADLFDGAAWYLTPGEQSGGLLYERLWRLVQGFGAHPVAVDAGTHDRMLAAVSHMPHVVANALVVQASRALAEEGEGIPRVGPSFRDATRVAGANSAIWTDIYMSNSEAIAHELDGLIEALGEARDRLRSGDPTAITEWNDAAGAERRRLHESELAAGETVHELRVPVPNEPGVLAKVALELARGGVNIVDMALAPAADMKSGQITLWVAGAEEGERARALIDALGFPVASDPS